MAQQIKHFYQFGPFSVDVENHLLLHMGEVVPLPPKAYDLLLVLLDESGRVLAKDELMSRVWPTTFVEEANLSYTVFILRKALGEVSNGNGYIETIPRRGYRFTAGVSRISDEHADIVLAESSRSHLVIEEESETSDAQTQPELAAACPTARAPVTVGRRSWKSIGMILTIAAVAVAILAAVVYYISDTTSTARSNMKNVLAMKTIPLTSFPDQEFEPALSPDGKLVAFAWTGGTEGDRINIYVMQADAGSKPLRLTTAFGRDSAPTWSPDGRFVAFVRLSPSAGVGGVFVVPALGGPERKLLGRSFGGLSWSPDGKSIAFLDRNSADEPLAIFLLSVHSLETRKLTSPPAGCFGDRYPVFSPDGQTLIFTRYFEWRTTGDLYVVPVGGGDPKRLTFDNRGLVGADWSPDGTSIVFSSDRGGGQSLWRIAASGGAPERLEVDTENAYSPTISRQGNRLAYTHLFSDSNIYRISLTGSSGDTFPSSIIASSRKDKNPRLSRDGKRIAFESNRAGTSEIWLADSDGTNQMQLTFFGGSLTSNPCWSPDGQQLALVSRPEGHADIYTISVEGGPPRRLTTGPFNCVAPSWSKDGEWIYFGSDHSGPWQVWKMPANGGEPTQITNHGGYEAVESPDSRFLYYNKYGFFTVGLFRVPVEGGPEELVLDLPQLESFGDWAVTDEGIYFIQRYEVPGKPTNHPAVKFVSFATNKVTEVIALEKDPGQHPGLNVSPDGQWLIYSRVDYNNHDIMLVENFR